MSVFLPEESLTDGNRQQIADALQFTPAESKYDAGRVSESVCAFDFGDNGIYLPLNFAVNDLGLTRRPRSDFRKTKLSFVGALRPHQKVARKEGIELLNSRATCILALCTGYGKTAISINMATKIGMPTLVVISRLCLFDQWIASISKFVPDAKIKKVTAKTKIDGTEDFYLMNAINVPKMGRDFYKGVGLLIVDELHLIGTEKLSQSMFYVRPRYAIGLSATPTRPDGMDALLYAFFGKEMVKRKLNRKHTVYRVNTGFVPTVEQNRMGKLDWNSVLNSQAGSLERNKLIVKIVLSQPERNFLILCKRVAHAKTLVQLLKEEGEDVTSLVGVQRFFDTESRVLVATVQKAGVGFDHPKLDTLLIAADLQEYFIQYLGRVFRTQDSEPIIYDLVDDFRVLVNHYRSRRRVYLEHGGKIQKFLIPDGWKSQ